MPSWPDLPGRLSDTGQAARTASLGRIGAAALGASLAAVIAIRLQLLASTDFPINDGALFLAFVQAIARVFPHLPASVDYNGLAIPFAYPPLSFWLAAAGVRLGLDPLSVMRAAPLAMNIGYVLLFTLLLLRTGHSRLFTAVAVLVFGTTFRSYEWLVMGGGLSRGLGSLFLLLTLLALLPPGLWRERGWHWPRLAIGGLCIGATLLSHLEWGLLCTFSALACLALAQRRPAAWLLGAAALGAAALAVVLPWFWSVLQVHGLAPFQAASQTGAWRLAAFPEAAGMLLRNSTLLLPFVLFGAMVAAQGRDVFWLLFMLAAALLIPRSGETPLVLGIGVLAATGLLGAVAAAAQRRSSVARPAALALGVAGVGLTALHVSAALRRDVHFVALPPEVRSAMAWVADRHPDTRFAIVREAPWYYDGVAEWFPVLARAVNTTTVQGREWLPGQAFGRADGAVHRLGESSTCGELLDNLSAFQPADFVWAEGVDLQARAAALAAARRGKTLAQRAETGWWRLRGQAPSDARDGSALVHALHGEGTAAGCFDAAGWQEVYANRRVRIFQPQGLAWARPFSPKVSGPDPGAALSAGSSQ